MDSILPESAMPLKYVAVSHCFRTEAGAAGTTTSSARLRCSSSVDQKIVTGTMKNLSPSASPSRHSSLDHNAPPRPHAAPPASTTASPARRSSLDHTATHLHAAPPASTVALLAIRSSTTLRCTPHRTASLHRSPTTSLARTHTAPAPNKKGRVPLSSANVRAFTTGRTKSTDSSVTSKKSCETSYVVGKIRQRLLERFQPVIALQFLPIITRELAGAQSTCDVVHRLIDCPSLKESSRVDVRSYYYVGV